MSWGVGSGVQNVDPHIENYSNIIINMHRVWLGRRAGAKGGIFFLAIT
jgi:hypothetical protein